MNEYKLLQTLPKPQQITEADLGGKTSAYLGRFNQALNWPIDTFITQQIPNYNKAIDYYYQKVKIFFDYANQNIMQMLQGMDFGELDIISIFNQAANKYNASIKDAWTDIQKLDTKTLQQNFNNLTHHLTFIGSSTIGILEMLSFLSIGSAPSVKLKEEFGVLDLSNLKAKIIAFSSYSGSSPRELGGHRAAIMGDLFEAIASTGIQEITNQLLKTFLIGDKKSKLSTNTIGQGKTDILITDQDGFLTKIGKTSLFTTGQFSLPLEASEYFDLTKNEETKALNKYGLGEGYKNLLGSSNKATISTERLGNFSKSAQEFRQRKVLGITKGFAHKEDAENFSAYLISKYLINVLGVYNGIMITGRGGIQYTYEWLYKLVTSGYHLQHTIKMTGTYGDIPEPSSNSVNVALRK